MSLLCKKFWAYLTNLGTTHHQGSMRGLRMARGSPLGKGAGTGVKRERRMERISRFFVFDISLIVSCQIGFLKRLLSSALGNQTLI